MAEHQSETAPAPVVERSPQQISPGLAPGPTTMVALASLIGNRAMARLAADRMLARAPIDQVRDAMRSRPEGPEDGGGVGDFPRAIKTLVALPIDEQINVLKQLAATHDLETLYGHLGEVPPGSRDQARASVGTVKLLVTDAKDIKDDDVNAIAGSLAAIDEGTRDALLRALIAAKKGSSMVSMTMEGLYLMMASAANTPTLNPGLVGVRGPVAPGPWAPPGAQPIPFYLGTAAHIAIAAEYTLLHPADVVRTNTAATSTILKQLSGPPFNLTPNLGALKKDQLDGEPDIMNLTQRHLYEIKPKGSRPLAKAEALWYQANFVAAGIPVTLGPAGERGTIGIIPAPGGVFIFESPEPGVILYEYKRQQLVEVSVPAEEGESKRSFRLAPMTQQQQQAVATMGVMTIMAIIAAIIYQTVAG